MVFNVNSVAAATNQRHSSQWMKKKMVLGAEARGEGDDLNSLKKMIWFNSNWFVNWFEISTGVVVVVKKKMNYAIV